jgi:hypothetical protein
MKKIIITMILLNYFCFSFTMWQWNPSQWEQSGRFGFILSTIMVSMLSYPLNELIKLDKKD